MRDAAVRSGTPMHLWAVGILSLLWNAFGAFDFIMTNVRDPAYLQRFPVEVMDYIDTMPWWVIGCWALGVWGAVLGSVLLLARSRFAVTAFAASLLGLAASTVYQQMGGMPEAVQPEGMMAMNLVIWAAAILFFVYALRMRRRGVLV